MADAPPYAMVSSAGEAPPGIGRAERWAVVGAVGFALASLLVLGLVGGPELPMLLGQVSFGTVAAMLGLSLLNYGLRGLRWHLVSRSFRLGVPAAPNLLYYVAGFALTATPGKLGEAMRLWFLRRAHGLAYERTAGLLLLDRLGDAAAIVLIALAGLGLYATGQGWTLLPLTLAVLLAGGVVLDRRAGAALAAAGYGLVGRWPRFFVRARRALVQTARAGTPGVMCGVLAFSLLGWLAEVMALALLLQALGTPLPFGEVAFIFAFSLLVGTATMLPGGLAGTEITMVGLLVASGVGVEPAMVATVLIRGTTLWFAVLLGTAALPLALRRSVRLRGEPAAGSA